MTDAAVKQDNWMSPLNKVIWYKAFKARATRVTIRDGRKFILDYDVPDFVIKTLGENIKVVHVRMAPMKEQPSWVETNFVPFGFFNLSEVTNMHWISRASTAKSPLVKSTPVLDS